MSTVLLTGGTGFVGKNLIKVLLEKGYSIRLLTRQGQSAERLFNHLAPQDLKRITYHAWPNYNDLPPAEAFQNVDTIIHLMGENIGGKRWSEKQKTILYESRIHSLKNMIKVCESLPNLKLQTFITSSAIGLYPTNLKERLTEESLMADSFLGNLCRDWEQTLNQSSLQCHKISVRTGVVLGKGEGALKKMEPIFRLGIGGPIGDGFQMMSWIHIHDLVNLYVRLVETYKTQNPWIIKAFNGVSPNACDNFTFSKALGKALHRPTFMLTPALPLKILLGEMSTIVLDSQHVIPKNIMDDKSLGFDFLFPHIESAFFDIYKN